MLRCLTFVLVPLDSYMLIDFLSKHPSQRYHTMVQAIVPRPIAWVLTDNGNETLNLAPFSYFTAVSSDPALLMFSAGKKPDGQFKDTVVNAMARQKMVIHIPSERHASAVTESSKDLAYGESELDHLDLELVTETGWGLPRISHCDIAMLCELYEVKEIGNAPQRLVFAEIQQMYVADRVVQEQASKSDAQQTRLRINAEAIQPLARLGGGQYAGIGPAFDLPFPR